MAANVLIHCCGVTKRFGDFAALEDVTFDVAGGVCALVGPNGAGKSTLLHVLAGLLAADGGEVRIAGLDIGSQPLAVKRLIGVLPEDLGLFDTLTVSEHLELCGPIYGLTRAETHERAADLLGVLGLEAGCHRFLDQCSHGMRKKTALAMALLHNPRVLLLDEPFEGIDPVSSQAIRNVLTQAAARGVTVFLTSHALPVIDRLATEVMLIRGGRVVFNSAVADLSRPLEELYFELVEPPIQEDLPWLRSSPS